jgi:hypothetical protein
MRTSLILSLLAAGGLLATGCKEGDPPPATEAPATEGDPAADPPRGGDGAPAAPGQPKPSSVTPGPAPECVAFTYGAFDPCQPDGTRSRETASASPDGCAGGAPLLTEKCTYIPPPPGPPAACASFEYSSYGPCQPDGTQTRAVTGAAPLGCVGGEPDLTQACTYVAPAVPCTSFTYSAYGACQANNTQSRTVTSSSPARCTGGNPDLTRACTYVPPGPGMCTSFTYAAWGACQPNGTQTRTVVVASPDGCTGGAPVLSQACTYTPAGPRDYKTFDGTSLTANRKVATPGANQRRMKPYSALRTELPRVLGATPASLGPAAATFGEAPPRWFEEPQASAVALQTSLNVAFDGCLTYTSTAARFGAAPNATTAAAECTAMARAFWSRVVTSADIGGCITMATTGSASEPNARRRWAYACTALINASGFLTY